jgi:acyl transferase domain-containing protein
MFILLAKSSESLSKQVASFNAWLLKAVTPDDEHTFLARISEQCLLRRTISHEYLAIFISTNLDQLRLQLDAFLLQNSTPGLIITKRRLSSNPRICFVFSGQGPQWWAMGRQLYCHELVFRRWIQIINNKLMNINKGEYNLIHELIEKTEQESRISDANITQPALFSIQVALTALLISWHIFPSAIVAHSAGEQAAAFVAGRLSLDEAICIVYHRSRLQHRNTRQGGGMLAVGMSEQEARDLLLQGIEHLVCVAVVNSPHSVTLSGEETIIEELETTLTTYHPKIFKARLRIQNAYHSHQMERFDIKKEMFASLRHIRGLPLHDAQMMFDSICANTPFYSSVTGHKRNDSMPLDAQYWWSNVRQCVRFGDAIQSIIDDEIVDAFIELSPHPTLTMSIRECYEKTNTTHPVILPTLKRKEDEQITLLTSIVQLSISPDIWKHYLASRSAQASRDMEHLFDTFPLYAFNQTSCLYESKESVMQHHTHHQLINPLVDVQQQSDEIEVIINHIWCDIFQQNQISIDTNIFTIGGHSLLVMQLLHQYNIEFELEPNALSITDLFQRPTIIDHAQLICQTINNTQNIDNYQWSSLHLTQGKTTFNNCYQLHSLLFNCS